MGPNPRRASDLTAPHRGPAFPRRGQGPGPPPRPVCAAGPRRAAVSAGVAKVSGFRKKAKLERGAGAAGGAPEVRAPAPARAPSAREEEAGESRQGCGQRPRGQQGRGCSWRPVGSSRLRGPAPGTPGRRGGVPSPLRGSRGRATSGGGVRSLRGPALPPGPSSELEICGLSLAGGRCHSARRPGAFLARLCPEQPGRCGRAALGRLTGPGSAPASAIELFSQKDKHPQVFIASVSTPHPPLGSTHPSCPSVNRKA